MPEEVQEENPGKVDLVSILYVVFGIPGIVGFLLILFALTRACDIPA